MAFLKTVLIIVLVMYGIGILFRLAMPYIMRFLAKKAEQHVEKTFGSMFGESPTQQPEGTVTLHKKNTSTKQPSAEVGEYVDFEEIE